MDLSVSFDEALCLWEDLLLDLLLVLVQLLLRAHAVHHVHHVHRRNVHFLLLRGQWSLCRLESLLLVLFFLRGFLRIFPNCSFVRVSEENRLLLWNLIVNLSLFIFLYQDTIDGLMYSLRRCLLEIFFFTFPFKIQNVFK